MASIASEVILNLVFEISNLNYPGIHVHVASNGHLHGLCGHDGLQTASEVTSGLGIELSDINYPCSNAYLTSKGLHELNQTTTMGDLSSIDERWFRPLVKTHSIYGADRRHKSPSLESQPSKASGAARPSVYRCG